jgi:hypothetical protein
MGRTLGSIVTYNAETGQTTMTSPNGLTITWKDSDGDMKVDGSERLSAKISYPDSSGAPITIQFFNVIENDGTVAIKKDDSPDEITADELANYDSVIVDILVKQLSSGNEKLTVTPQQALDLCNKADTTFRDIPASTFQEVGDALATDLAGLDCSSIDSVAAGLKAKGYCDEVIGAVRAYLSELNLAKISVADVAAILKRCAFASITGGYDALGIPAAVKESMQKMLYHLSVKAVNKENVISWLHGEEITDPDGIGGGGGGGSGAEVQDSYQRLNVIKDNTQLLREYNKLPKKVKASPDIAKLMTQRFSQPATIDTALGFIANMGTGQERDQLLGSLANIILDQNPKKAFEIVQMMTSGIAFQKEILAKLPERLKRLSEPDANLALDVIDMIIKADPNFQISPNKDTNPYEKPIPIAEYRKQIEAELSIPANIRAIREEVMPGGTVTSETAATAAITNLEKITDDNAMYAKVAIADIYAALAKDTTLSAQVRLEYAHKAQVLYKEAFDEFTAIPPTKANLARLVILPKMVKVAQEALALKGSVDKSEISIIPKGK